MERMAMESLPSSAVTTTGCFLMEPTPMIATCGCGMMGSPNICP